MPGKDPSEGTGSIDTIANAIENALPIGSGTSHEKVGSDLAKPASGARKGSGGGRSKGGSRKPPRKPSANEDDAPKRRRPPQRDSLMALVEGCTFWHDPDGEAYATVPVREHRENLAVGSDAFRRWLGNRAFVETGLVPGSQALQDTIRVLEARAAMEGRQCAPWVRVGAQAGRLYLDLVDDERRVIAIGRQSWSVVADNSLPFLRHKAMRALPEPEAGCEIDELRRFVNVASDADFVLVVAWLVAALRPTGPYPVLIINGEQGSGKSTFARLLRTLVDPNAAPIRAVPKDDRDLIISAANAHVLAMDNLSKVEAWLSDALCRLATGGGFSARKLHTDHDEFVFMGTRPIVLNGIEMLTSRADLADRAVTVRLRSIPEEERRPEDEFWADWSKVAPRVLGALCDALSSAIRNVDGVRLERAPRLADFAKWSVAAEPGLGWEPGTFMNAYGGNRREVFDEAFEADTVAVAVVQFVGPRLDGWEGTATELLSRLNDITPEPTKQLRSWPKVPQGLSARLERCAPLLRAKGLHFQRRHSGERTIRIIPMG